jgi:aldehyde:ferredoxin oxidoreductase
MVAVVKAITGWDVTLQELLELGEGRLNMLGSYNAREGISREEDILPKKIQNAIEGGASDGNFIDKESFEQAQDLYYSMAGWDVSTGMPTKEKLEELDLGWIDL